MQHLGGPLSFLAMVTDLIIRSSIAAMGTDNPILASLLIWDPPLYIISPHNIIFGQCQCKRPMSLRATSHTSQEP
jgi:hypothetical protein